MCGIVGLYLKNKTLNSQLGKLFSPMLLQMGDRGPDSSGIAVYRDENNGSNKITLYSSEKSFQWEKFLKLLNNNFLEKSSIKVVSSHAILNTNLETDIFREWLNNNFVDLRVMSTGNSLEIYKEIGMPEEVIEQFNLQEMNGSHMIGHTRMATESAVTTEGAHPFNTGQDLCLVHNGSLSNHHELRRWLSKEKGISFQTENDSEVAAGYLSYQLREGFSLEESLKSAIKDLDGFYTFAIGTKNGFAVLRDPIACKPAVLAECNDWVAMGSEFRALSKLPNIENADVWEPEPGKIYSWGN
tara:strand:- start:126 stop:1022 length:897 start_codon:yes stop_codon:yes gene_type:complete